MEAEKEIACASKSSVNLSEIGTLIKEARQREGLTQRQLANELGVNKSTISLVENGSPRTGKELLNKLAKRFGLQFDLSFPFDEK